MGVPLFRTPTVIQRRVDPAATWDEARWLRSAWEGPLVVKGVLTPQDCAGAFEADADAVVCSNHGGRVLDGDPASLDAAGAGPGGPRVEARGSSRRRCPHRRRHAGEAGVDQVVDIYCHALKSVMTQLERRCLEELDASVLEPLQRPLGPPR